MIRLESQPDPVNVFDLWVEMEQPAENPKLNPNPENLNGAGGDNGENPNLEEVNEAGQNREAIRRLGECTDN